MSLAPHRVKPARSVPASAVAVLLASAMISGTSAAGGAPHQTCLPARAHTVVEDRQVRVFALEAPYAVDGHRYTHEVTYACLLRTNARMKLGNPRRAGSGAEHLVALDGTMVAYTRSETFVDTGKTEIVSANVATRRVLLRSPEVAGFTDACIISFREVKDLVVTEGGAVAWILRKGHGCKTETFQVYDQAVAGEPTLLDEGPEIEPESLRVTGRGVGWEDAGERRYAALS
ncbi:MAG TPA: hypothetical protein VJL81_07935 [Solirubrobacterales bacterium]|nr:hypothetical protein [Solirubrobacterales bacterium]